MKPTLKAASITGYGGGITPDVPSLRVVSKCPLNQTIAKTLGVQDTLYTQNGERNSWSLNLFERIELKGRIDDAEIRLSKNGEEQYDTIINGYVDHFKAINDDGAAILKFRVNTELNDELMIDHIASQGKEAADSIKIEARQRDLFVPEEETAAAGPEQQPLVEAEV